MKLFAVVAAAACVLAGWTAAAPAPASAPAGVPAWQSLPAPPQAPDAARTGEVAVAGVRLHYAVYGQGTPVLLLHGGMGHGGHWSHQIAALADAGFQAIALDSRGHGRSGRDRAPMHYARMADDAVALLDHLGIDRVAVVGWSDGGIVGLDLAVRHPQRVSRLLAFGANYRTDGIRLDLEHDPVGEAYGKLAERDYLALSPAPDAFADFAAAMGAMWKSEPDFSDAQLAAIRVPVLVAAGYHEEYIRMEHTLSLTQRIPGAELAILPGMSHFGPWQAPALFNAVMIDFLRR